MTENIAGLQGTIATGNTVGATSPRTVTCPTVAYRVLGGGVLVDSDAIGHNVDLQTSYPSANNAWTGTVTNKGGPNVDVGTYTVYIICAEV